MGVGRVLLSFKDIQTEISGGCISYRREESGRAEIDDTRGSFRNIQSIRNPSRNYPNMHRRLRMRIDNGDTSMIDQLLEGNKKFRETVFKQNFDHYQELVKGQSPPVLWIGCSDSRIQTGHITQMKPGHLFIQRNIGNVAPIHDWNFATVLEYAIKHLKVRDIVICGHSDCGAIKALDKELDDVYIPLWLNNAIEAKNRVDSKIKKPVYAGRDKKTVTNDRTGECAAPDRASQGRTCWTASAPLWRFRIPESSRDACSRSRSSSVTLSMPVITSPQLCASSMRSKMSWGSTPRLAYSAP